MPNFLLCAPDYFAVDYVINPWMEGNLGRVDLLAARRQWDRLYDLLAKRAKIDLIAPVQGLPDMVFTANAALLHGNCAILSSFHHSERMPEALHFADFFLENGYRLMQLRQGVSFEGAGDALFDASGRLWIAYGFRSDEEASRQIASLLGMEPQPLQLVDPRWYHLDTCFCPLAGGYVLVWEQAFSPSSLAAIREAFGEKIIWVSLLDAQNFACNAVNVGDEVILHRASPELVAALNKAGFTVLQTDVSEFLKAGGACKCLTLAL